MERNSRDKINRAAMMLFESVEIVCRDILSTLETQVRRRGNRLEGGDRLEKHGKLRKIIKKE
jgi:hypothetical protein